MINTKSLVQTQYPLSSKRTLVRTVSSFIRTMFPLVLVFIFFYVFFTSPWASSSNINETIPPISTSNIVLSIYLGISLLILFVQFFYQKAHLSTFYYDLTSQNIVVRKGPISPGEITIAYERVQDVYVKQGLLDRMFGLYNVYISSATGNLAYIDGLERASADGVRNKILEQISLGKK